MPFLRFSRDKRGYENTYVLHTFRRDGKSEPRLLYWFRTPPGVKVGRIPLDADAIRTIEANNPGLTFDWSKMLKVRPAPARGAATTGAAKGSGPARRRRGGRGRRDEVGKGEAGASGGSGPEMSDAVVGEIEGAGDAVLPPSAEASAGIEAEPVAHMVTPMPEADAVDDDAEETREVLPTERPHPVVSLMGEEALTRFRARYAELQLRIDEKAETLEDVEAIRARAEALNPDEWTSIEAAVTGIESFEAEAEAIRKLVGRRPPRTRLESL